MHFLEDKGHTAYFLPKFHCELNPIERVWGQAKRYSVIIRFLHSCPSFGFHKEVP